MHGLKPFPPMSNLAFRQREVRQLARACDRAALATAYGHCSVRLDEDSFLVCASKPMGLISPQDEGTIVTLDASLPDGVLGEVRMHREVYRLRSDVNAIVRFISPNITALAALGRTPRARHGFGAYFAPEAPMWRNPELVRNDAAAAGVARVLGSASGIVVSVNGAVVAGANAAQALALAVFLEDSARVELASLHAGCEGHRELTNEQCRTRATWAGRVAERMWDYWTQGDPEYIS
ncbi:class II aldolase/adducin family protein [Pusillimonas noertemannii]|uniref:HCOMODA/2-hydroxy-3-carboxy-muconic semialdehyde decarboxylase n=1 Tax=Pusillimonas noertemannii TaxID=305977 RepID=A0A2U1CKV7_9BURK|nr:class II aldolase/adducin family protein [Pusillimonas noertemannii]PVY61628.1 HCOMODA/2-hydroxy-3-carboxy-muconic semialdehyde decarboxylase [Pusillimonas noertemannii]